jgi:hypothetical protein
LGTGQAGNALVGAGGVVAPGKVNRLAEVADLAARALLDRGLADVVLVALGDDEVAGVVGPDVKAGDDALREAILGPRLDLDRGLLGAVSLKVAAELVDRRLQPALEHTQASRPALLWVELAAEDVAPADRRDKDLVAVLGRRVGPARELGGRLLVRDCVRVDKVEVLGRPVGRVDLVLLARRVRSRLAPAHVRDRLLGALVDVGRVEARHSGGDDAEAGDRLTLFRRLAEDLHADADAKVRAARLEVLPQRVIEPTLPERRDGLRERADAGEEQFLGGQEGQAG